MYYLIAFYQRTWSYDAMLRTFQMTLVLHPYFPVFHYSVSQIARIRWDQRWTNSEPTQQSQLFLSQDLLNNDVLLQNY